MIRRYLFVVVVLLGIGVSCDRVREQFGVHGRGGSVTPGAVTGTVDGEGAKPPPMEAQAVELAAREMAINLRLLDEKDADKRARLEREMLSLREQRRSLYQTRVEGK